MKNIYLISTLICFSIHSWSQPEMKFSKTSIDLGTVHDLEAKRSVEFIFKNTGDKPLQIFYISPDNRQDECEFPDTPVNPSDSGTIIIHPKLQWQLGYFGNSIRVYTNMGYDKSERLSYTGRSLDSTGPRLEFEKTICEFDSLPEGVQGRAIFKFTNKGNRPLLITNVNSSCGCLTPEWSREPVMPGKKGEIKGVYNSNSRLGPFNKSLTVTSNSIGNNPIILVLKGEVIIMPVPLAFSISPDSFLLSKTRLSIGVETDTLWYNFGDIETGEIANLGIRFSYSSPYPFHPGFDNYSNKGFGNVNLKFALFDDSHEKLPRNTTGIINGDTLKYILSNEHGSMDFLKEGLIIVSLQNLSGDGGEYLRCQLLSSNSQKRVVIVIKANLTDHNKNKIVKVKDGYETSTYFFENGKLCRQEKKYPYKGSRQEKYYFSSGLIYKVEYIDKDGNVFQSNAINAR
jgi:hypothetical protein